MTTNLARALDATDAAGMRYYDAANKLQAAVMGKCDQFLAIIDRRAGDRNGDGQLIGPISAKVGWKNWAAETVRATPGPERARLAALLDAGAGAYCPAVLEPIEETAGTGVRR